jgi:hypothetical protein
MNEGRVGIEEMHFIGDTFCMKVSDPLAILFVFKLTLEIGNDLIIIVGKYCKYRLSNLILILLYLIT